MDFDTLFSLMFCIVLLFLLCLVIGMKKIKLSNNISNPTRFSFSDAAPGAFRYCSSRFFNSSLDSHSPLFVFLVFIHDNSSSQKAHSISQS